MGKALLLVLSLVVLGSWFFFDRNRAATVASPNPEQTVREMAQFLAEAPPATLQVLMGGEKAAEAAPEPVPGPSSADIKQSLARDFHDIQQRISSYFKGASRENADALVRWTALEMSGNIQPDDRGLSARQIFSELARNPALLAQDLKATLEQTLPESETASQVRTKLLHMAYALGSTGGEQAREEIKRLLMAEAVRTQMFEGSDLPDAESEVERVVDYFLALEKDSAKKKQGVAAAMQAGQSEVVRGRLEQRLLVLNHQGSDENKVARAPSSLKLFSGR